MTLFKCVSSALLPAGLLVDRFSVGVSLPFKAPGCTLGRVAKPRQPSDASTRLYIHKSPMCIPQGCHPVKMERNDLMFLRLIFSHFCHAWCSTADSITLRAKLSGAVYCNRSCLCVFVCGSVTTITRNCVHRHSPNWVCR